MKNLTILLTVIICAIFALSCQTATATKDRKPQQVPMVIVANETAALARLHSIVTAEESYMAETSHYGSLDDLISHDYIRDPSQGKLTGYRFDVRVTAIGFEVTAVPEKYGITGNRSFYIDQSNVTRAADRNGAPATASDPQV
jgi:hypothetical protein